MLSVMEQVPGWEQQIAAFNHGGGHSSVLSPQQWVGESSLDGLGLTETPFSGMGDNGEWTKFATDLLNRGADIAQKQLASKGAKKTGSASAKKPAGGETMHSGGGGGGESWIEENKWYLIAAAVVIGGLFLFSVTKKGKKHEDHHD